MLTLGGVCFVNLAHKFHFVPNLKSVNIEIMMNTLKNHQQQESELAAHLLPKKSNQSNQSTGSRSPTSAGSLSSDDSEDGVLAFATVVHPLERTMAVAQAHHGLIQGKVTRDTCTGLYQMLLQNHQNWNQSTPLYSASKKKMGVYEILDSDGMPAGTLYKTCSKHTVLYTLMAASASEHKHHVDSDAAAYIRYDIPSLMEVIRDVPLRQAQVVIGTTKVGTRQATVVSKGRKALNFYGRGRKVSRKNLQLQDCKENLALQFVKWDKDEFHLDYQ